MADEPRFPPADEARSHRGAYRSASALTAEPDAPRVVVTRAEPPPESAKERPLVKLTAEETRALLDVGGTPRDGFWQRGRVVLVPTGLIMGAVGIFFGAAAPWIMFGAAVVAFAWMARPLFRRDGW